jgi:hypothetical protein
MIVMPAPVALFMVASQGKYSEAEPLHKRSLAIRETALGKDHPTVALALENMARCSEEMWKLEEAKRFKERAMKIRSDDRKLLFEPVEALTQKSGKFQLFFYF